MKLRVQARLNPRCVEFLRDKLAQFDTSQLEYFRLYDRTGKTVTYGVWGRCAFPNRKKGLGYRIRCSLSIAKFPYPARWTIGSKPIDKTTWEWIWREDQFFTREEAFVWLAGHEAFHWLRHSQQIPGRNVETQANRHGYSWLDEWRKIATQDEVKTVRSRNGVDVRKARVYFADGHVEHFSNQVLAFALWLALPKGVRAAFRGENDRRPVYPWNCVDAL